MLFYGQDHFDTLAILSQQRQQDGMSESRVSDLMKNQKLFSNKELMLRNMTQLCYSMRECEDYIQAVVDGRRPADPEVAHALNQCISQFSSDDLSVLETMVRENFQDAMMVNTLAKLQHAQITMTEKLNNIFTQSVNKGSSRKHHLEASAAATNSQL